MMNIDEHADGKPDREVVSLSDELDAAQAERLTLGRAGNRGNIYQGARFADGRPFVLKNGAVFDAALSQSVRNHSPDGFEWGYGGSGPSQLALALCISEWGVGEALRLYQDFKFAVVASFRRDHFTVTGQFMGAWRAEHDRPKGGAA